MALVLLLALPAYAVVGGAPDSGPLSRASVMVLNAKGGVCSGIVLAPDAVLTAAHCTTGAGQYRVHFQGQDGAPVLLEPASVAVHPGYDSGAVKGRRRSIDLALVHLASPLPAAFRPAALSASAPRKGASVTLGGYGVARERDGRSMGSFRTATLSAVEPHGRSSILLWASSPSGAGACQGDSGGPISGPDGAVTAVTSWAVGTAQRGCGGLTQGVLVGPQRAWIDRTLARWGREAIWQ